MRETEPTGIFKITNKAISQEMINEIPETTSHLILYQNKLGESNMFSDLKKSIQYLFVWSNQLSDLSIFQMPPLLFQHLIHLDLSRNFITDHGAIQIFKHIKSNSNLIHLDLSFNNINDHAIAVLKSLFGINIRLITLNLSNNRITDKGCADCCELTRQNEFFTVQLQDNHISEELLNTLNSICDGNKKKRLRDAREYLMFCRNLYRIGLPLPFELILRIATFGSPCFNQNEIKAITRCLMNPCFIGWVHSPLNFSADELVRRCKGLLEHERDFGKLQSLIAEQKRAKLHLYDSLIKYREAVRRMHEMSFSYKAYKVIYPILEMFFKPFMKILQV